ncbi:MAG: hypothetical protein KGN37_11125 [Burkholderiales bacterium]|nr:hypothetical protein [Burkholderiales bacterium]MDE2433384.1 hypothetical protein [Burkholderiales bacterium]
MPAPIQRPLRRASKRRGWTSGGRFLSQAPIQVQLVKKEMSLRSCRSRQWRSTSSRGDISTSSIDNPAGWEAFFTNMHLYKIYFQHIDFRPRMNLRHRPACGGATRMRDRVHTKTPIDVQS